MKYTRYLIGCLIVEMAVIILSWIFATGFELTVNRAVWSGCGYWIATWMHAGEVKQ